MRLTVRWQRGDRRDPLAQRFAGGLPEGCYDGLHAIVLRPHLAVSDYARRGLSSVAPSEARTQRHMDGRRAIVAVLRLEGAQLQSQHVVGGERTAIGFH